MTLDEQRANYELLCQEQSELRRRLHDVNLRKMVAAVRMTHTLFKKPKPLPDNLGEQIEPHREMGQAARG